MRGRGRSDDRGAAAVEFALISVPFMLLVLGVVQYGYYFFQATAMEATAREAARTAAVGIDDCAVWLDRVEAAAGAAVGGLDAVSVERVDTSTPVERGDDLEVIVSWHPLLDIGLIPLPSSSPAETAVTRLERIGLQSGTGCSGGG